MIEPPVCYKFGDWLIEPSLNRVSQGDIVHRLEPRAMDVLFLLLSRPGQVVTTDELLNRFWTGVHREPSMVAKRINQIRRVLGDQAKNPTYVETIPKRGYRAIAAVSKVRDASESSADEPDEENLAHSTPPRPSIAVLPLENLSGDAAQDHLADGITEELITELGRVRGVRVLSRTSVLRYKSQVARAALPEIAGELDVDFVVSGSATREEKRIVITVQLIDARKEIHLWSDRIERDHSRFLSLRHEIACEVAGLLRGEIVEIARPEEGSTHSPAPAAFDAYVRGLSRMRTTNRPEFRRSEKTIEDFEQAVALDPDFAEAWAQLALARVVHGVWRHRDDFRAVREAAYKALSLDRRLANAHAALGFVRLFHDWDPAGAGAVFERALKIAPDELAALQGYQIFLRLEERFEEALRISDRILMLAPGELSFHNERIVGFYEARLFERVIEEAERVREFSPNYVAWQEAAAYHKLGRFEDSHRSRLKFFRGRGEPCDEARSSAEQGWKEGGYGGALSALLDHALTDHESPSWESHALNGGTEALYAQAGGADRVFTFLERAVERRVPWAIGIRHDPAYDFLRLDPRFEALLAKANLPAIAEHPARTAEMGRCLAFQGRSLEAFVSLRRAISQSPEDPRQPRWFESMAWAHFATADDKEAKSWVHLMLERKPAPHAEAFGRLLLASSLAHLHRPDEARVSLKKALNLWPRTLETDRDLRPLFLGGSAELCDRYLEGLRRAGLEQ